MALVLKEYSETGSGKKLKVEFMREYRLDDNRDEPVNRNQKANILQTLMASMLYILTNLKPKFLLSSLKDLLHTILLPVGYPDSVCPEYIQFQLWDTLQEACGYFRGILSNQAWLTVLGVGNARVTVVSAVVMTMMVDYSGMVSGLYFASSRNRVRKFSANQKHWTMVREILILLSTILTLVASAFPEYMIYILIFGRLVSTAGGVISGSCQSTLVTHIARKNNFSDCNAKESNQNRMLKLLLIGIGYKFLIFVNETAVRVLLAFIFLSFGKIFFNYQAMRTLRLRTLSENRLFFCIEAWYKNKNEDMSTFKVSQKENVLLPPKRSIVDTFGSSLSSLNCTKRQLMELERIHENSNHILIPKKDQVDVILKSDATSEDYLRAYIHAFFYHLTKQPDNANQMKAENLGYEFIQKALTKMLTEFDEIMLHLETLDWDIENLSLFPIANTRIQVEKLDLKKTS